MSTSTDVAVRPEREVAIPVPSQAITQIVAQYATDLQHCASFAEAIIDTPFVPAGLWPAPVIQRGDQVITLKPSGRDGWDFRRRHPQESDEQFAWRRSNAIATAGAIVYSGAGLKLNWQAALSGIYVANGRTSLYAEQMRGLILADGHTFDVIERTADRCTVSVARRGEQKPTEFTFTMAEAIRAGYVKGKGPNTGQDSWKGNDRYNTNPADMLFARATSIASKAKFADVIRGMETRETLDDDRPAPVDITATVEVSRPAERATAAAIMAAASQQDGADPDARAAQDFAAADRPENNPAPVERAVLPITDPQMRALGAIMTQLGVTGTGSRERRLAITSRIVDHPIGSSKDLTKDEASTVIDTLTSILNDPDGRRRLAELESGPQNAETPDDTAAREADELGDGQDYDDDPNGHWDGMDGAEAAVEELRG